MRSCARHADVLPVSADEISLTGFEKGVEVLTTVAPASLDKNSINPMVPISLGDEKSKAWCVLLRVSPYRDSINYHANPLLPSVPA